MFQGGGGDAGSSDAGVMLVQNLEKKTFKKFEFMDEKIKKTDEQIYHLKTEISNIKKFHDETTNLITENTTQINTLNENTGKHTEEVTTSLTGLEEKIEQLKKDFDEKIANGIPMKKDEEEEEENIPGSPVKSPMAQGALVSEEDLKMIKANHKHIAELDKSLKLFINGSHLEQMKTDIGKLEEDMLLKANSTEIDELKDQICKFF